MLAHRIAERLAAVRKGLPGHPRIDWLRPDGKSQVSVEYEDDRPVAVRTVVVSTQHAERRGSRQLSQGTIREAVIEEVIKPVLDAQGLEYRGTKFLINPTGRFVIGGPHGDAGSPAARSSWTPTAAWPGTAAGRSAGRTRPRWTARPPTPRGGSPRTWWRPSWRGAARCRWPTRSASPSPVSVMVQTFGTGAMPDARIERVVNEVFDLTPKGIIDALKLRRPIYRQTATYGHFGRRPVTGVYQNGTKDQKVDLFTWERTDRVKDLLSAAR